MFENAGKMIKGAAKVATVLGIILSVLGAVSSGGLWIVVLIVGCLSAWLGGLMIYGFGELVESTRRIADRIAPEEAAEEAAVRDETDRPILPPGWTCPHCGTRNKIGEHRCSQCGKS